ncbi:MAG: carboxypeptidase-like regulatory domain-containing protein [Planctomycetota bacterium]
MARRYTSRFGFAMVWMLSLSLALQPYAVLANPTAGVGRVIKLRESHRVADVQLQPGGTLIGQVVDVFGAGLASQAVELSSGGRSWRATTDSDGWFRFGEVRGGVYQFRADEHLQVFRIWAHGTSPPNARRGILVTPSEDVFRGQRVLSPNTNQFFRVAKQRLSDPLVVSGVIVTAVAIPVAIHNSDDDPPAS